MRNFIESDNIFLCENICWVEILLRDRIKKYWLDEASYNIDTVHIYSIETIGFKGNRGFEDVDVYFSVEGMDQDRGEEGIVHFILHTVQESIELGVLRLLSRREDNYNIELDHLNKHDFYCKEDKDISPSFSCSFGEGIVTQPSVIIKEWGLDFFSGKAIEELLCYHLLGESYMLDQAIYCLQRVKEDHVD